MKTAHCKPDGRSALFAGNRRAGIVATVSAMVCATSVFAIQPASAAVPTFPDNIVVFPDRDFVTIEGYQDHIGETATVEVSRGGKVVGSAQSVVAAGDVAFEINHPGGVCWGAGTGLNVTPDILPGDVVSMKFGGSSAGETKVQDTYVTESSTLQGNTVTVKGYVGSTVNTAQMEQRIIEPALDDTSIARRDVRALPGPVTPSEKGGYSSGLEITGTAFTATYVFEEQAAAELAANAAGARSMAWEVADADDNRQGLTISEYGEPGGPGMGGCPNGPLQSGPPAPSGISAAKVSGGLKLNWTPAEAIPGTPAITGYRAVAVSKTETNNERVEIGKRISNAKATGTTITGLSANEEYEVYVVGVSSVGETFPAAHAIPVTDTTAPTVSATPNGGTSPVAQKVTLTASETGSDIYYTTDGTDPVISGGNLGVTATKYTAPLDITATTTLRFAAFDPSGNVSTISEAVFTVTNDPVPAAPTFTGTPVVGKGTVSLSWNAPDPGATGLTVTGYTVQAYTGGTAFGAPKTTAGDVTTLVYDGLNGDTAYQFTVRASNTNGMGPVSAMTEPVTVQGALVAMAGPDQNVVRGTTASTVTLNGAGSTAGATYKWEQILSSETDPDKVTLEGATTLTPKFSLRVFKTPMTNNPLTFRLTVTAGTETRTDEVRVIPVPDRVTIGSARWRSGDFRITGTGSLIGSVVTVHKGSPTGPVLGQATVTAAVAPATGGEYTLRLRNAAAGTTNPGPLWIESTAGGTAGPVTATR